jgi:quinol monooxygenase YgiN
MRACGFLSVLGAAILMAACGDDSGGEGGSGGSGGDGTTSATGPATSSSAATSGTSSSSTGAGGGGGAFFLARVEGQLFTADMDEAQAAHDMLAQAGQAPAQAAGDFAHDVHLGVDVIGTPVNQFSAFDRWTDATAMATFYADPMFQQAFGALFASPPVFEAFAYQPDWYGWGDLDATDTISPHYWAVVRGRLASADIAAMEATHDQIAQAGEAPAAALGDLGHVVFLSLEDPQEFLAIDLWDNPDGPVTLYTNPDFQAAFATLFESPPQLRIYGSTDWHQW